VGVRVAGRVDLFPECPASIKVLNSLENSAGDHCVDIFVRDDGTFVSRISQGSGDVSVGFRSTVTRVRSSLLRKRAGGGEIKGGMDALDGDSGSQASQSPDGSA